jgi:O-antigen/teichoic acid export membrane protein
VSEVAAPRRSIGGGAAMMLVAQGITAVSGALTTVLVARLLGPSGTGSFTIALTVSLLLGVVGSLGLEAGMTFLVSSGRWSVHRALWSTQRAGAALGVAGGVLVVAVALVAPDAFGGLDLWMVALVGASVPFSLSWLLVRWLALTQDRYGAFVVPFPLQSVLALVAIAVLAATSGVAGTIVGLAASQVLTAAIMLAWALRRLADAPATDPVDRPLRAALGFGIKANASQALQFLNYRLDLFVLSAVAGSAIVGQYSVAVAVTSVLIVAPQALASFVFPRVAELGAEGTPDAEGRRAALEASSVRHMVLITVLTVPLVALVLVGGVELLYGRDFRPAIELGLILLPGVAMFGLSFVLVAITNGRGRPGYSLVTAAIATPVTVLLYFLLIPSFEGEGAALTSTLSYGITFLLSAMFFRRVTGARILPLLLPTRAEVADYARLWQRTRAAIAR